jgi:hypothetical protein
MKKILFQKCIEYSLVSRRSTLSFHMKSESHFINLINVTIIM